MNKKDFEVLENADDETVEKLGNRYPVFDEKKREEIYKMTMKKMKEQNESTYTEYSSKVEGVEKYKRPVWQRVSAIAAAAAIVAGGALLFSRLPREGKNKSSDHMTEVATDTTDATNSTKLLDYEEYIELMQPQADSAAAALYNAANAALTEMNEEKELNELCIICSDESNNYNVSIDFNTDSFYDKLHYYFNNEEFYADYDYFIFVQGYNCIYTVCEKKKFDDIYDFPSDPRNNTDDIYTGLIATYPHEIVLTEIREKSFGHTDLSDLMEEPTFPRPTIYELYDICVKLMSEGSSENTDTEQTDGLFQIYDGEDYQEYADIAVDFIDKYEDLLRITNYGTSCDENDEINFKVVPYDGEIQDKKDASAAYDADDQKIYDDLVTYYEDIRYGRYNRSTDERFNDIDDIKEYALSIISEKYFNQAFADNFTDNLAGAKDGDTVTSDRCSLFTVYDEKLYVQDIMPGKGYLFDHWTDTPIEIYDVTETSFKAVREWSMFTPEYEATITDPEELESGHPFNIYIFKRDSVNDEWRIDEL